MSSRYDAAPRRRSQEPAVVDPEATGVFTVGKQGEGLQAVSPEDLARARAATAEARTLRTDRTDTAPRTEQATIRLADMTPANRVAELDRRIADFALLSDLFSGVREPEDLNAADRARAREALERLSGYQKDVPDLRGKSEPVAIEEIVQGLRQWRNESAKENAALNEPAPKPRLEQFARVRPKGYGSDTDWYILSVEQDKGTYIVANRTLVQRDRSISARDIVGNIRRGTKDNLGIFYQRNEPVGFEMAWQDLERLTGNGA